jgi:transmembrane sensor
LVLIALKATRSGPASPAPVSRTYTTVRAQRAELRLTDGTRVVLAPGSKLRIATDFGTERRDIYLDGEAFFEVVHDELRPFTVYAGNASAHDIGTAFSVRSYAEDRSVQIVVREGVVAMSGVGPLAAGDVGLLSNDGMTSVRHGVDVEGMFGWLEGKLAFEDAPLARVADDLRRWHGIDIEIRDSALATLPFTGAINDLSPSSALDLVAATLGLRVMRDGERFVLTARPGRTPRAAGTVRRASRHKSASTP